MQKKTATVAQTPDGLARKIWLNYLNDYLRNCHVITEESWRRMRIAIEKS